MAEKIRVLMICLTRRGGLLHFNDCLADGLSDLCDVGLITAQNAVHKMTNRDVTLYPVDTGSGAKGTIQKLISPKTWIFIKNAAEEFKPDIVHITSAQEWNPFLGSFVKHQLHKPLVYTIHDVIHHQGTPKYMRITENIFRRGVKYTVVLTEQGKKIIINQGKKEENTLVVPHGIYDFFTKYADASIKEQNEILFFGRIEQYKGLDVLLKSVPTVFRKCPDWYLHIAGGGDITPYKEALNSPHIHVPNRFVTDEEVAKFMQRCPIVALPYLSASQSGVIPTAFAFGKAVIATNVGGIPDVIKDHETGLLIPPNDPAKLSAALIELIENPALRKKLGENGQAFANEYLGWNAIAKAHKAFYEKILAAER